MASCELDYRMPTGMQTSNSEEMEEGESSEDEARLSIVENSDGGQQGGPRTFLRSLSVGDGSYSSPQGAAQHNASDAVESLLLLGQGPVFASDHQEQSEGGSDPGTSSGGFSPPFPRFSGNQVEQRMMVNYYQKMRERNNEASKRCRLKRRIKQDSLDKTKILLESHREALSHRVAKLHKIKNILNDACRSMGQDETKCDCRQVCGFIKAANREMPDLLDLTNRSLVSKSRKVRETNMEEMLTNEAQHQLTDMRPLKRGPRKQDDFATQLLVDTLSPSPSVALDLSSSSFSTSVTTVKREAPVVEDKKFPQVSFVSKPFVPLAPKTAKAPTSPLPMRRIIVDNPHIPLLSPSPSLLPLFTPGVQVSSGATTIKLPPLSGTNTIILTPLGPSGLPSTVLSLPTPTAPTVSLALATPKQEEPVVIKSEPDLSIVEMEEQVEVKVEAQERDPTTSCCAVSSTEGPCSQELVDVNSLTQMLDLVTMEPKLAGELTAAEKYIIKSRLRIEFWKAEETPTFICSAHRRTIVHGGTPQVCSLCGKRKSKKFDMYFITYRMAVEFYMTEGKYLSIGRLACSGCKLKGLKGLDFSNTYLVPESGHPLDQREEGRKRLREEDEERRGEKREVVLQLAPPGGRLATIQPLPPRPQAAPGGQVLPSPGRQAPATAPPPVEAGDQAPPPYQQLHAALTLCNPAYRPPGFTITSLSECSGGVLQDAIRTAETAVSTILSAIAPGQEAALWRQVSQKLNSTYTPEQGVDQTKPESL